MLTVAPLLCLIGVSGYGLFISYSNITRLQKYEERSERAAEWSNTAAERLQKTRTTQGAAAITVLLSLLTSMTLLVLSHAEHHQIVLAISLINTAICFGARIHMANFWKEKVQLPFMEAYNEAIRGSNQSVSVLTMLGWGWVVTGLIGWLAG
ncbi:uncharacterized protein BDR25DRAFT_276761 [Lindgomyces ingoldianus]|uniref:Uncharacterized protein n=1 Tax=Lindgomyces ingoldianus TaxID=673940 RepID=A0ACB6RCL5_9PLEO|nr:uncharacterized protein BDR25DRAFT_276761 [Lindgomyces ingoldianus]KAF2477064.1 hypothetical protein BDR25DRAFT_276761 [Lindgomyces ingoldianus]